MEALKGGKMGKGVDVARAQTDPYQVGPHPAQPQSGKGPMGTPAAMFSAAGLMPRPTPDSAT
eukprot:3614271-Pyramimonas_sp.AAC.1